ncbi:hypothetical protein ACQ4M3_35320 [Leptolyngbya sp. AN03gr2]|uniref:hypothetical protein n=1 Tax=unclassified Leptolyngbya TaxID=2650499 RepID=UPI003D3157BD
MHGFVSSNPEGSEVNSSFGLPLNNDLFQELNFGDVSGLSVFDGETASRLDALLQESKVTGQPQTVTEVERLPGGGISQRIFSASFSSSESP